MNGETLLKSRVYRKLTIEALADKSGISKSRLSKQRHNLISLTEEEKILLSQALNFPKDFFELDLETEYWLLNRFLFRNLSKIQFNVLSAKIDILLHCLDALLNDFTVEGTNNLEALNTDVDPADLARLILQKNLMYRKCNQSALSFHNALMINRIYTHFISFDSAFNAKLVQSKDGNLILVVNKDLPLNQFKIVALREIYFWLKTKNCLVGKNIEPLAKDSDAEIFTIHTIFPDEYLNYLLNSTGVSRLDNILYESNRLVVPPQYYVEALSKKRYLKKHKTIKAIFSNRQKKHLLQKIKMLGYSSNHKLCESMTKETISRMLINKYKEDRDFGLEDLSRLCSIHSKDFIELFGYNNKILSIHEK